MHICASQPAGSSSLRGGAARHGHGATRRATPPTARVQQHAAAPRSGASRPAAHMCSVHAACILRACWVHAACMRRVCSVACVTSSTCSSAPWYCALYLSSPGVGTGPSLSQSGDSPGVPPPCSAPCSAPYPAPYPAPHSAPSPRAEAAHQHAAWCSSSAEGSTYAHDRTVHLQCICSGSAADLQWICSGSAVVWRCTRGAHTRCTHTVHTWCTHGAHTVHSWCVCRCVPRVWCSRGCPRRPRPCGPLAP